MTQERAILAAVYLPSSRFDERDPLGELRALAQTAGATVVGEMVQHKPKPDAGTFMGSGKVEELKATCDELDAGLVIFDHDLSPRQIANIEEIIGRKVLDRSELILDIFAGRATTYEAKLQVELAQLQYTYPRLRAMWDHLERIVGVGGIGGIGTRGPGETQLETDRRLAQTRELQLRRELDAIQARRRREVRARNLDHFTVGIVGYTNAGKSTLFNTLTAGGAFANDQLFATLVTRTREWQLDRGVRVMLSDTVGFVRDLPHNLVASFRATLEEATHADLLLIVLDVSDPSAELQYETVQATLEDIFKEARAADEREGHAWREPKRVVLLNKADALRDNRELLIWQQRVPGAIPFCAKEARGLGHAELVARVLAQARGEVRDLWLTVPLAEAKAIHSIEHRAEVLERDYTNGSVRMRVRIGSNLLDRLRAGGTTMQVESA
ncbi:MAG: GTPase HflX [Phycisphaerae bacterium]|nr:GTPase HflX [Phycisphaerae bacterium]